MRTLTILAIAALAAATAGCSTLNRAGIGGKPELQCRWATGEAVISDRVVGTRDAQAQLTVVRRIDDADVLCLPLLKARVEAEGDLALHRAAAASMRRQLEALKAHERLAD